MVSYLKFLKEQIHKLISPRSFLSDRLMLGWDAPQEGWTTFDIGGHADYQGNIVDLSIFANNSFNKVYASHVFEHINYLEARHALQEVFRVLKPGGLFFIAVPDVENLSRGFKSKDYLVVENAMDVIYGVYRDGGRLNDHKYGYTRKTLTYELKNVGFRKVNRFQPFFEDASKHRISKNISSSLNLVCQKPKKK